MSFRYRHNLLRRNTRSQITSTFDLPEKEHRSRWTWPYINHIILSLPDDPLWNTIFCAMVFVAIIINITLGYSDPWIHLCDIMYNVIYASYVLVLAYYLVVNTDDVHVDWCTSLSFLLDVISYMFYILEESTVQHFQTFCYCLRLHRPLSYLLSLNKNYMQSSVLGTTLKYCYLFLVLRLFWVIVWFSVNALFQDDEEDDNKSIIKKDTVVRQFISSVYVVNKMFLPIGPSIAPKNDVERIVCLMVMLTGCIMVTGAAVASLSLIISIYMRPEETFRTRYRLIIKEMETYNVLPSLREKVKTFYKMYWHKQGAVSAATLLPTFPPCLTATIYTDIYFKAMQKCRILRDLSYQFLSEIAKKMETIHYIPGDAIIKRNEKKSSIIYIAYGDIEMLTAEDDSTAMLRLIRGTILSPCGGCPAAGSGRAHVEIRAATFCTAHVLSVWELWKTVVKYGRENGQGQLILWSFDEHFERVIRHFHTRYTEKVKYKSSILHFKRNLMHLKESKDDEGNPLLDETDVMIEIAGCYIMRNRADASLTDEADAICLRPTFPCILQPNSSLQVAWNTFVTGLIITVCITHPYFLVYKKHVPLEFRFYDYVVTVIYVLDLLVYLSTGANVEDGVPITFAQTSSQQARDKWFVLDVIGTLPIFEFIHNGHFAGLNKLLRLPKVFRVLKSMEEECVYHSNVLRFLSFSLLMLLACYLLAALQQGFLCFHFGYCSVSNFTQSPYWEQKPLDNTTVENTITFGLYWAISMVTFTSHLETWGIENWNNVIYTMFVMEICIVLYIFMEAVYSATIMVTTALREDFDACIENVTGFLIRNNMDLILRQRFIEHLQLRWYTDKAYSITNTETSIFYDLPSHVYQDIVTRQRSKYILSIPFMKLLHKEDLKTISSKAKLFCSSPNEILLNTGDMSNEMYVIKRGICEIISPDTKDVVSELHVRNHFGVIECLLRIPAFYTVRTVTHVEVFSISRKYLLNAIDIPQIRDAIEYCKEQPQYSTLQNPREPFLTYIPPEPTPNRDKFRLPRKFEKDNAFLQPFHRLGVFSVLRQFFFALVSWQSAAFSSATQHAMPPEFGRKRGTECLNARFPLLCAGYSVKRYIFPRFTIRPDCRYILKWEWGRAVCALLSATLFPSYTYIVRQFPILRLLGLLLDCAAYFDILQRMLVGYYNDKGIYVYHPASSAAHYIKGAFLIDLFACFSFERLETSWKESLAGQYRESSTRQFLMLNRVIQLYRIPSALASLSGHVRRDLLLVMKATPIFLALLNVLTCFVVFYSVELYYSVVDYTYYIVPLKDEGGSWIDLFQTSFRFNITESPWNLHLACYFWVVYETTTTGFGSFKPTNLNIMQVLIAGMLIGAMITAYFSVRIISIRANVNKDLASFQEHMKDIANFMKRENIDVQLQKQVMEYYKFSWDKTGGIDYRNILKLCDQITLRTDAILHIYGPIFAKCPILDECDVSLLRIIGRGVRSFYFLKNTTVIDVDDVISDIYFVDQGCIAVADPRIKEKVTLTKGSIFGNLDGPSSIRCPISMTSSSQVHLLQINSQAFFSIISDFPAVAKLLTKYRPNNEYYINAINPFISYSLREQSIIYIRGQVTSTSFQIRQSLVRIYLIIVCLLSIYGDVYNAGFVDNRPILIMGLYLLDFCFFWKFLIQYFIPRLIETYDEDVKQSFINIRNHYFKHEFKYDLISFIPIELFCFLDQKNRGSTFALLRLNRFFRIVTIYKCLKRHHERISVNLTLITTCSVLIWFTISVHVCTCFWYFLAVMEEKDEPQSSWIYKDDGRPWCNNYYICSLYFVMTTFTSNGVGDILPKKQSEVIFVSLLQMISTMMYMVYVGELSNIIQYQSYRNFYFYSNYLELQEYLKNNRVSQVLCKLVNKYSVHLWRETRGLQVPYFLKTAPNCLKINVMAAAYLRHLADHQLFKCCEPAFLRQLVVYLQLHTYDRDMFVVKENEITGSMYIVHVGRVKESCEKSITTRSYYSGEFFGELQGLVQDLPFKHSYKTVMKSQILTLYLKDWEDLLNHFPKSKRSIYKYLRQDVEESSSDSGGDNGTGGQVQDLNNLQDDLDTTIKYNEETPMIPVDQTTQLKDDMPGPSKDNSSKEFIWPLKNRISIDSRIDKTDPEEGYSKTKKFLDIKEIPEIIDIDVPPASYNETISEIDIRMDTSERDREESLTRRNITDYKRTNDMKSVEDYIQEQHSTTNFQEISKKIKNYGKRRKPHVQYSDAEAVPTTSHTESHELKPIRDTSTEEKNLNSLDSDMQPVDEQNIDNSNDSPKSNSSNTSQL